MDLIETWGFREDIKGIGPNSVDLVQPDLVDSVDLADSVLNSVSHFWDLIETWGFREDNRYNEYVKLLLVITYLSPLCN